MEIGTLFNNGTRWMPTSTRNIRLKLFDLLTFRLTIANVAAYKCTKCDYIELKYNEEDKWPLISKQNE